MVKIMLYIEGGGESHKQDIEFRAAWREFFSKLGLKRMPGTFRGSSRNEAFQAYCNAVKTRGRDELPLLLVDSEDLVTTGPDVWDHLEARDNWTKPARAGDKDAYLMICCMETWFIADRDGLNKFFPGLVERHLRNWPDLEQVPKPAVFAALKSATARCRRAYSKGDVSFELLSEISPAAVEQRCSAARLLLDRLRKLLK